MRLRLVKLMPFYGERFGGSARIADLICRELARRGHEVTVITSDLGGPVLAGSGYHVIACPTRRWHRVAPYLPPPGMAPALRAALRGADLLCVNVGLSLVAGLGRRIARAVQVPYVYNAEGALDPVRLRHRRLGKRAFLAFSERAVLRDAAALQAVTADEADWLVAQGADPHRVHVIPNAVSGEVRGDGAAFRKAHGIGRHEVVILYLGRLHTLKGIDLALRAAAPLLRARGDVRFVVAGPDDGEGPRLRALVQSLAIGHRTLFCGPVPAAAVSSALAAADVFALTSHSEGLSLAALEAAVSGLPLWLSDRCGLPEVTAFGAGTVDPPDEVQLRRSLAGLLADPGRRAACGRNAAAMVRQRFELSQVVSRLEALYADVAAAVPDEALQYADHSR
jgi:glycosyltransferase involved in cell wall biosynthesis